METLEEVLVGGRIRPRLWFATRWWIAILLGSAIAISYLDRQTLPVAFAAINREIPISETQFSNLNAAFLLAYAGMYMGGGKMIDVLGARRGFLAVMLFWSAACAAHGLATGFWFLAGCRFALGLGEGGGFPAAIKAIAEWFPAKERSLALGVLNCGTALGSMIAPPVIAGIVGGLGWRWVFFITGGVGVLWTVWWVKGYFSPSEHPTLRASERAEIEAAHEAAGEEPGRSSGTPWLALFSYKETWGLMLAKFFSDAAWFLYAFWLPKYLYSVHHFDTKQVGAYAWIPYAAAGVGSLWGGSISSFLLHRGRTANFSRKVGLVCALALMPWACLVTLVPVEWVIVLFSVTFFGHQAWSASLMILPTDLYPRRVVGSVAGLMGCSGALGGVVLGLFAGRILETWGLVMGYRILFTGTATLHVVAFGIILLMIPRVRMVAARAI